MAVSEEAKKIIEEEKRVLDNVLNSLRSQRDYKQERLVHENQRARELTSEIVRTHRDEDKWLLASDEAVSHGIKDQQKAQIEVIDKLLKNPYFARMILKEETEKGARDIEYKIGLAENSECRIIDWRKAPIARLYYEYKEGDDYCEEIQGRERAGTIAVRRMLETQGGVLKRVSCGAGDFLLKGDDWETRGVGTAMHPALAAAEESAPGEGAPRENLLPQIASLLSPEQFALIADNSDRAMLVQGIAGSGKTTVALHRLAWLFADPALAPAPDRCLVVVLSRSLKTYISRTLPALGVEGVRVLTLVEWFEEVLTQAMPGFAIKEETDERPRMRRPAAPAPSSFDRLMRCMAMLRSVEQFFEKNKAQLSHLKTLTPDAILLSVLKSPREILEQDETKLLDDKLVAAARERLLQNAASGAADYCTDALLIRILTLQQGGVYFKDGNVGKYEHIFADEVQDLSPVDLACILGAVKELNKVTVVGDTAQKIDPNSTFPGWDKLRKYWSAKEALSHFISLDLSYRSTIEILRFADHIQQQSGKRLEGRHGRVPIWFKCLTETRGIAAAQDWLTKAIEKYPSVITAVVCRDAAQARQVLGLLRPTFGPAVRIGEETDFSFEGGIVVTHAAQVRGLEFTNLLLWNPGRKEYPADALHRNLLYLAVSRTRENLCIVSWTRASDLLPSIHSPLVRGYDIATEELEQMEREQRAQREP